MAKIQETQKPEQASVDLTSVLARLDSIEAENQRLKAQLSPENKHTKWKEKYTWPWNYSYKLWWDVPVLSYKSFRKDKTKDFSYKNHLWVLINNHFLELLLADNTTVEVDVNEFNLNRSVSEKLPAEVITDWVTVTGYKFNDPTHGQFIVSASLIN